MYSSTYEPAKEQARQKLHRLSETNSAGAMALFLQHVSTDTPALVSAPQEALNRLSLEEPEQFSMSWTTWTDINKIGKPHLEAWADSLRPDKESKSQPASEARGASIANQQFWPMIAEYGLAYNLLVLQKFTTSNAEMGKAMLKEKWSENHDQLIQEGRLYFIDMMIFTTTQPQMVNGVERFTPGTFTVLSQDKISKQLTPISITVSGYQGADKQTYVYDELAEDQTSWLYALQAAKTSITVYGIWLGHVYQLHIVTAALQMTMYNHLPQQHPVYQLLHPQSNYVMGFDNILLLLWGPGTTPPTSIASGCQFLELINYYADGRQFFDDDPDVTLSRNGLSETDFSLDPNCAWDLFPIAQKMLSLKKDVTDYVAAFVNEYYTDESVQNDTDLQNWMNASSHQHEGNIAGIPQVSDRAALIRVLTSIVYRIILHGASRLSPVVNPAITFTANFPPCLQNSFIPVPSTPNINILDYLPNTGTIGEYVDFSYIFVFSTPYEPFLPFQGYESNLFFGNDPTTGSNQALIKFRERIYDFSTTLYEKGQQIETFQWPMSIES